MARHQSFERTLFYITIVAWFVGAVVSVDFGTFHLFPFRILFPVLVFFFVARRLSGRRIKRGSGVRVGAYLCFLGFWLFYAAMSSVWAADKGMALKDIVFLLTGIVGVFLIVYYMSSISDLEKLRNIWIVVLLAMTAIGLWEITTGNHWPTSSYLEPTASIADRFRPSALFYNTNDLANLIALSLPFVFVWIQSGENLVQRLPGMVVLVVVLFVLTQTTSRSAYLGILAAIAFDFFFLQRGMGRLRGLATIGFIALVLIGVFPDTTREVFDAVGMRLGSLSQEVGPEGGRQMVAETVPDMLLLSFGMGVGPGNSVYYIQQSSSLSVRMIGALHNWWLEILSEYGIFVFVGYVVFFVKLLWGLYKARRRMQDVVGRRLGEALIMGMIAFPFASFANSSIMALPQNWIFIGFALAFLNVSRLPQEGRTGA
jgi:teichuronic acid biosynthesis protein TuaE